MRERAQRLLLANRGSTTSGTRTLHDREPSEGEAAIEELMRVARLNTIGGDGGEEVYPKVVEVLKSFGVLIRKAESGEVQGGVVGQVLGVAKCFWKEVEGVENV